MAHLLRRPQAATPATTALCVRAAAMDGLDALLNEAQQERDSKTTPNATPKLAPLGRAEPKPRPVAAPVRRSAPPGTPQCAAALKAYLQRLLDPDLLEQISRELSKRSFEEVDRYACGHPELAKYTIEQELPRMEYIVVSPAGERLTTVVAIRELFERGGDATAGKAALLWRLANQSLLGVRGPPPHAGRLQPFATLCNLPPRLQPLSFEAATLRDRARGGVRGGWEAGWKAGREAGMIWEKMDPTRASPRLRATPQATPSCPAPRSAGPARAAYVYNMTCTCTCTCTCTRTCTCARPQDLLVPLRLWMDVDLGIAVGAACSEAPSWRCSKLSAWLPGAGYLGRTYLGLAMLAAYLPGVAPLPGASYSGSCRATHAAAQGPMGGCGAAPRPGRSRRFRRLLHRPGARSLVPLHTRPAAVASGGACAGGPLTADHGRGR